MTSSSVLGSSVPGSPVPGSPVPGSPVPGSSPSRNETKRRETRRVLNVPLLVGTLIGLAALAAVGFFWWQFQVSRTAGALLSRAESFEAEEAWMDAVVYRRRYLRLVPDDEKAQIKLADTYDKWGQSPRRTRDLYYNAVGVAVASEDPEIRNSEPELRRRLAEILLDFREFASAQEEAKHLGKEDAQGWYLLASAMYGQWQSETLGRENRRFNSPDSAITETTQDKWPADSIGAAFGPKGKLDESLERALALNPGKIDLTTTLARVYRQAEEFLGQQNRDLTAQQRAKKADDLVDQMVALDPKNPDALLARYLYRAEHKLPEADDELTAALHQDAEQLISRWPDHLNILFFAANRSRRTGQLARLKGGSKEDLREYFDEAAKVYSHIIAQVDAGHLKSHLDLGEIHYLLGEFEQAVAMLKKGHAVEEKPGDLLLRFRLHARLAEALSAAHQLDQAAEALDRFESFLAESNSRISRSRQAAERRSIALLRGELLLRQGYLDEGIRMLRRVVLNKPTTPQEVNESFRAWQRLGMVYAAISQWMPAAEAYERAANLRPTDMQARLGAARSWAKARHFDQAIRWYQRALELKDVQTTWLALAYVRLQQQLLLPQSERDWEPFKQELAQARTPKDGKALMAVWRVHLLDAQFKLARAEEQQKGEEAAQQMLKTLRNLEQGDASSEALLQELVPLYQKLESPADADRAMEAFVKLTDDSLESYVLRARTYTGRGEYQRARKLLETRIAGIDALDIPDPRQSAIRRALVLTLVEVHLVEGDRKTTRPRVNVQQARAAFEEALKWNPKNTQAYERLVALFCQIQEFGLARGRLREAQQQGVSSTLLHSLEIMAVQGSGEVNQAVVLARDALRQNPGNPLAKVRLGQLLLAAKKTEEAETVLREALYLAPTDLRTIDPLFNLYVETENLDRAKAFLAQLDEDDTLTEIQRTLTIARGYEVIGNRTRAEQVLEKAAADYPDDVSVHRRRVIFLLRHNPLEARSAFKQIVTLLPESDAELRRLARFLAEYHRMTPTEKHPGKDRLGFQEAIEHLEGIVERSAEFIPLDHAALAQLYEAEFRLQTVRGQPADRLRAADNQHRSLVTRADRESDHLAAYLNFLLRHVSEAPDDDAPTEMSFENIERWLEKLEKASPDSLAAVQLRGRWLLKQDRASEIEPLVEAMAEKAWEKVSAGDDPDKTTRRQAQVCVRAANLYMALEQYQAAVRWSKRLQKLLPEQYGVLALCLARQGQMKKAIELCIRSAESDDSPQAVLILISVLTAGEPSPEDFKRAEPLMAKAAKKYADNPVVLGAVAGTRILQRRDEDAVRLYKQVLKLKPRDVAALNNLATLLCESKQPRALTEALRYIDRAINATGERSLLLDTKGMILLQQGKPQPAVTCLEAAVAMPAPDPRYYFHLAVAYLRSDMRAQAEVAFRQALDHDLEDQLLLHTDQELLTQMRQEFVVDSSLETPSS